MTSVLLIPSDRWEMNGIKNLGLRSSASWRKPLGAYRLLTAWHATLAATCAAIGRADVGKLVGFP